jgi:ABC-type antimicrobial peptide transport system permease subunit
VLKAIGFKRHELFALILAESFSLAMAGAFFGVGGAWLFFTFPKLAGIVAAAGGAIVLVIGAREAVQRKFSGAGALCVLGALLVGAGYFAFTRGTISQMTDNIFITFEVTPRIAASAVMVAATLGILASIAPSLAVMRMSVVQGLKTLD